MTLQEARQNIDLIDPEIRNLIMRRMDCSIQVAAAKQAVGSTDIYRADREAEILEKLGTQVSDDRRAEYLAIVRKIMETSRMYQYGLIYDWNPGIFSTISGSELLSGKTETVTVRLTRPDQPNSMSSLLCMIGDYGYNMDRMEPADTDTADNLVTFDLTISGNLEDEHMKKLVFQLSKESYNFRILELK